MKTVNIREGADLGTVVLESSREFWNEIERRRKSGRPRKKIEQLRKELGGGRSSKGRPIG